MKNKVINSGFINLFLQGKEYPRTLIFKQETHHFGGLVKKTNQLVKREFHLVSRLQRDEFYRKKKNERK